MIEVPCSCCNGTGKRLVDGVIAQTLRQCPEGVEFTAAELASGTDTKATAMNNRLAVLQAWGLLASRVFGRKRLFRRVG